MYSGVNELMDKVIAFIEYNLILDTVNSRILLKAKKMKQDYKTSTVEGARGFVESNYERYSVKNIDYTEEEVNYVDDEDDECNCSDPGCPCRGQKRGYL